MSDYDTLTLEKLIAFKRRITPLFICHPDDLADLRERTARAREVLPTLDYETNDLMPRGVAMFKPPMFSPLGTWPLPREEQLAIYDLRKDQMFSTAPTL